MCRGVGPGIFSVYRLLLLPAALTVMAANVFARLDLRPSAFAQLGLWLLVVSCLVLGTQARLFQTMLCIMCVLLVQSGNVCMSVLYFHACNGFNGVVFFRLA